MDGAHAFMKLLTTKVSSQTTFSIKSYKKNLQMPMFIIK